MEKSAVKTAENGEKQPSPLLQEAISAYHICKDGTVVGNPKDCQSSKNLHPMDIEGLAKS